MCIHTSVPDSWTVDPKVGQDHLKPEERMLRVCLPLHEIVQKL